MNTRTTIILLVVAIALGASMLLLFNQEQKAAQEPVAVKPKAQDLFDPKPAAIVQVRVEQPDHPARLFEKRDDDWFLAEPIKAKAQKTSIEDDARSLGDLQYIQKYEPGAAGMPGDDLTGLKQPGLVLSIRDKDGAAHTLRVGNVRPMTQDETYVSKDNDPALYVVKQNLPAKFARPLKDYRERRVVDITFNEITRATAAGTQNYEIVKSDDNWVLERPVRGRTDKGKVEGLLQAAANLYAEEFVADDDANLRIYGLTQPQLTLSIVTEKKPPASQPASTEPAASQPAATQPAEVKTTTILVGGKSGSQYFAKLADQPGVFQIPESTFKNLNVPLLDLRDKAIAQIDAAKVKGLEVTVNGQSAVLARQNGRWQMAGAFVGPAETSVIDDLLKAIGQTKVAAFEDQPRPELTQYGFENPRARIRIVSEGKVDPVEILVGGNTPSGEMVFVRNVAEGGIAVLKKTDADALVVEPSAMLERSVFSFNRDDVRKIERTCDGRADVLVRQGDAWQMTEPIQAAADHDAVNAILADLSTLRARKVVAVSQDEKYGLTEPQVIVKVHLKEPVAASQPATRPAATQAAQTQAAGTQPIATQSAATQAVAAASSQSTEKVYTLVVSRKGADVYARMGDGTWVYQLDPVVNTHLTAELHDRTVAKFEADQAASIKVPTDTGQTLEFVKKGDKWTYLTDPFFQVDDKKIKEWLGLLSGTRAERYVAYNMQNAADYGLATPLFETEITLANGKATKLIVAKPTESGKYVATVVGTTAAFELPAASVKQLQKPLSFFKGQ
jgi:hypothetical protein